jgi:hypothetical protein
MCSTAKLGHQGIEASTVLLLLALSLAMLFTEFWACPVHVRLKGTTKATLQDTNLSQADPSRPRPPHPHPHPTPSTLPCVRRRGICPG